MKSAMTDEGLSAASNGPVPTFLPPKPQKHSLSPSAHRKPCSICHTPSDVLVSCRIDDTPLWHFVCPKKCWKDVSGGVVDGDSEHPYYKYGGMWKNKHAGVSAKKPNKSKAALGGNAVGNWQDDRKLYVMNDKVHFEEKVWVCRRKHESGEGNAPGKGYRFWKEDG